MSQSREKSADGGAAGKGGVPARRRVRRAPSTAPDAPAAEAPAPKAPKSKAPKSRADAPEVRHDDATAPKNEAPARPKRARRRRASKGKRASTSSASSTLVQVLQPDGTLASGAEPGAAPDELVRLLEGMLRIRLLDGRMLNLQRQGRIGFFGQSTGQEGAIVGSAAGAKPTDWVCPALREAGVALYRGYPIRTLLAQLKGSAAEVSQGRQMPCHHSFREGNFVSMSSVIGTQLAHAVGIARAAQIRRDDVGVLGYLGDGASSSNDFHSSLNFAAVWKAPVVFVCQNNQWAISVPFTQQTATRTVAEKAGAYGMPGVRVDGNDVLAVRQETRRALETARTGGGPTFIEALTYRILGHSSADDPTRYREDADVEHWRQRDPIERLRLFLAREGILSAEAEEEMQDAIHREISESVEQVERDAMPPLESLVEDVFKDVTPQLQGQMDQLQDYVDRMS